MCGYGNFSDKYHSTRTHTQAQRHTTAKNLNQTHRRRIASPMTESVRLFKCLVFFWFEKRRVCAFVAVCGCAFVRDAAKLSWFRESGKCFSPKWCFFGVSLKENLSLWLSCLREWVCMCVFVWAIKIINKTTRVEIFIKLNKRQKSRMNKFFGTQLAVHANSLLLCVGCSMFRFCVYEKCMRRVVQLSLCCCFFCCCVCVCIFVLFYYYWIRSRREDVQ